MSVVTETMNLGDLLKFEASHLYSRDQVTVASGRTLSLGTVVATRTAAGKVVQLDPAATDGADLACGVLLGDINAEVADRTDGLLVARHAIVAEHALIWPAGITPEHKAAAVAKLKHLGVLIRASA
jgi:hypothetical protein